MRTEKQLWQLLESEEQRIKQEVSHPSIRAFPSMLLKSFSMLQLHRFSLGETVAAIQAMIIYIIMMFDETDSFAFLKKSDMFGTMKVRIHVCCCVPSTHWLS
jgi:hypothetical protein